MNQIFIMAFYENWEFWTNAIGTLVTVFLGLIVWCSTKKYNQIQVDLNNDKLQKELFTEFNIRYNEINDYLEIISEYDSLEALKRNDDFFFLRSKLNDYFNLCAEEYFWYKKGRIDDTIWKSWESGINSWYNNKPIIKEAWENEYKSFGHQSYYLKINEQFFKNY